MYCIIEETTFIKKEGRVGLMMRGNKSIWERQFKFPLTIEYKSTKFEFLIDDDDKIIMALSVKNSHPFSQFPIFSSREGFPAQGFLHG